MTADQSSLSDERVKWFEDMEHIMGHFSSELDALESELRHRDEQRAGMVVSELGFLLLYLKGWRETGEVIIELTEKCERLTVNIYQEENASVGTGFYADRAEYYQRRADDMRELAGQRND
jgi:hypothetical protein